MTLWRSGSEVNIPQKRARLRKVNSLLVVLLVATSCGGSGAEPAPTIAVAADATFCSIFEGEYQDALSAAVPASDDGFEASAQSIVAWAAALRDRAPAEISDLANDNLRYHEAQAAIKSASEFIPGSNAMHEWARANC